MSASIQRIDGAAPWLVRTSAHSVLGSFTELGAARDFLRARGYDHSSGYATSGQPEVWALTHASAAPEPVAPPSGAPIVHLVNRVLTWTTPSALPPAPIDDVPAHPSDALDPSQFDVCNACALQFASRDAFEMPATAGLLKELMLVDADVAACEDGEAEALRRLAAGVDSNEADLDGKELRTAMYVGRLRAAVRKLAEAVRHG